MDYVTANPADFQETRGEMTTGNARAGTANTRVGMIGGGWRARTFRRVLAALPERFTLGGTLVRTEASAAAVAASSGAAATTSLETFLRRGPYDFVVVAVPRSSAPGLVTTLARQEIPVLCE